MNKKITLSLFAVLIFLAMLLAVSPASAEGCTETGYYRDNINLTAAYVNPTTVTSPVDATECNIGVYYDHNFVGPAELQKVEIYGANYFGVLVNGDAGDIAVNIKNSKIHHIGDDPFGLDGTAFSGAQHGVAIYYMAMNEFAATGVVDNNEIFKYQKNGITVNGPGADVSVTDNTVTGEGRIDYIAQNGIQFGWEAMGKITGNEVSGNYYDNCEGSGKSTCLWVSAGILLLDTNPQLYRGMALQSTNDLYDNQYNVLIYK
jgi:hypothetical protein